MIFCIYIMSVPFRLISIICEYFDLWNIRSDVQACLSAIDTNSHFIPKIFISYLIIAEDRRNAIHYGVDPIAIIRAVFVRIIRGERQGASTIEQQFVRVVTNRYQRSFLRKFKEQIVAVSLLRRTTKNKVATSYLCMAFYGSVCEGYNGIQLKCGSELKEANLDDVVGIIARLKYPEPLSPTIDWDKKIKRRIHHIMKLKNLGLKKN